MKINHKILSIPPYISTSWKNVLSLRVQNQTVSVLTIELVNGTIIEIPDLPDPVLKAIFAAHERFLEQETHTNKQNLPQNFNPFNGNVLPDPSAIIGIPFKLGIEGVDNLGTILQHSSEGASSPDLPKEVVEKIVTLAKVVGFDNVEAMPKPEPHCNCIHCQIMRAIHFGTEKDAANEEDIVSEEDLKFRDDWEIERISDKLYLVLNPLNKEEHYNVFLGEPIGCTCGKKSCEHIAAVLKS
ncbi:MAG: hypothetical protein L0207_04930 [Chlamydiae bacterium]|nr:hypothetical protein [Chlamydiota bacterium]